MRKILLYIFIIALVVLGVQACRTYYFRSNYMDANSLIHSTNNLQAKPFLKAHLKNGDVCLLKDSWKVDTSLNYVQGIGTLFNFNREEKYQGTISILIDSVAIFETNVKINNPESARLTALALITALDVAIGAICATNPKTCFGSCPTFYINENDNFHYADAEGFSNAISPSMEYSDIDALNTVKVRDNTFSLTMKNEALETHCVKEVKILAFPVNHGERVYQSPTNNFYLCENNYFLSKAFANEGEITKLLKNTDREERFSLADENNLSSKEEIFLTFNNVERSNNLGLILNFRQTMMTTYLFYSAMGYMGDQVSDIFAMLETDEEKRNTFDATTKELGGIEVYVWNEKSNEWLFQSEINETGPIAINRQIIPLKSPQTSSEIKVKLVLNKGLWRLDYSSLTKIIKQIKPYEVSPTMVINNGKMDHGALSRIMDPNKYLLSMPGNEYKFTFILPESNKDYEMFLKSKGYYLEWMRSHWLKDKDLLKLKQMVDNPKKYLREEAHSFKEYEAVMEQQFWNSKINTKTFSYNEI